MFRIAIVGMDGTGKSSVIERLSQSLGKFKCRTQYMGFKDWETQDAIEAYIIHSSNTGRRWSMMRRLSVVPEMYYRTKKYSDNTEIKVVIYDRYATEQVLFHRVDESMKGKIISIFYRVAFACLPKIDLCVYLTCTPEVSLYRKADIDDLEYFNKSKKILDDYYIERKKADLIIDTEKNSIDEVVKLIMNCINKKGI